ncbi:MAG: hypothetical protein WA364_12890 [Candidatus Nitrosopolaris sp.]
MAANDPVLALSDLKPNFYDLLLVDIDMPRINGFELCGKTFAIDLNVRVCLMSSGTLYIHILNGYLRFRL